MNKDNDHIAKESDGKDFKLSKESEEKRDRYAFGEEGDDTVDESIKSVKEEYIGNPEVDPIWAHNLKERMNAGKRDMPEPILLKSEIVGTFRRMAAVELEKGLVSDTRAKAIMDLAIDDTLSDIKNSPTINKQYLDMFYGEAITFTRNKQSKK